MTRVVAYTREEGGIFFPGEPPDDNWNAKVYADGRVFDRTVERYVGNGWRPRRLTPEMFQHSSVKWLAKALALPWWRRWV